MSANDIHEYAARIVWEGNTGAGTSSYAGYGRQYRVQMAGKPDIMGSADPGFRGEAHKHNPEELLVIALSSCHMLSYLALCARNSITVVSYSDDASGVMKTTPQGGGKFESVTLRPRVSILERDKVTLAMELHEKAHELCFIASSCNFPIRNSPVMSIQ